MRCRFCGSGLQPVHGHGACLNNQCPMYGLNQDECCNGETLEVPLPPDDAAATPVLPPPPAETPSEGGER